jgi:hypothetical protein
MLLCWSAKIFIYFLKNNTAVYCTIYIKKMPSSERKAIIGITPRIADKKKPQNPSFYPYP